MEVQSDLGQVVPVFKTDAKITPSLSARKLDLNDMAPFIVARSYQPNKDALGRSSIPLSVASTTTGCMSIDLSALDDDSPEEKYRSDGGSQYPNMAGLTLFRCDSIPTWVLNSLLAQNEWRLIFVRLPISWCEVVFPTSNSTNPEKGTVWYHWRDRPEFILVNLQVLEPLQATPAQHFLNLIICQRFPKKSS